MHHYFEAITNTSGDSLVGYFARVIDPASQNTVPLSSDNNGTPIDTVSGVINMAVTDKFGNVSFYVAPGTYHLDIYAPNATSFIYRVSNVAMNSTKGDKGDPGDQGPPGEGLEAVMAPSGASLVGFAKSDPIVENTVQERLAGDTFLTDAPYNVPVDASPATSALSAMLASLDTSGGSGVAAQMPKGRLSLTGARTVVPNRVTLASKAIRSGIVSLGTGAGFTFDGVEHSGLRRMRVGMDASPSLVAIDIKSAAGDVRAVNFSDVEIAGAAIAGQIGARIVRPGSGANDPIVTECITQGAYWISVDKPIIDMDSEGNFRIGCVIDGFAYGGAGIAMDLRTHANIDVMRIARGNTNGSTAYKQAGTRNIAILVTDIGPITGPNSDALNITGTDNLILLQRPEGSTRLGYFAPGNTVIDGGNFYSRRMMTRGGAASASNFILTGWGDGASVTVTKGDDQSGRFIITSLGTGQTANPTVAYTNQDGVWPFAPKVLIIQRNGGNQPTATRVFNRNINTGGWNFQADLTPVAGEGYEYDYLVG